MMMLVTAGGEVVSARIAWRAGARGRMRPRVVAGDREIEPPATVDVVEVREDEREVLAAAGYRVR